MGNLQGQRLQGYRVAGIQGYRDTGVNVTEKLTVGFSRRIKYQL